MYLPDKELMFDCESGICAVTKYTVYVMNRSPEINLKGKLCSVFVCTCVCMCIWVNWKDKSEDDYPSLFSQLPLLSPMDGSVNTYTRPRGLKGPWAMAAAWRDFHEQLVCVKGLWSFLIKFHTHTQMKIPTASNRVFVPEGHSGLVQWTSSGAFTSAIDQRGGVGYSEHCQLFGLFKCYACYYIIIMDTKRGKGSTHLYTECPEPFVPQLINTCNNS